MTVSGPFAGKIFLWKPLFFAREKREADLSKMQEQSDDMHYLPVRKLWIQTYLPQSTRCMNPFSGSIVARRGAEPDWHIVDASCLFVECMRARAIESLFLFLMFPQIKFVPGKLRKVPAICSFSSASGVFFFLLFLPNSFYLFPFHLPKIWRLTLNKKTQVFWRKSV